jgi:copper(I)-binding protein
VRGSEDPDKVGLLAFVAGAALATSSETEVMDAWTTAGGESGGEAPLYMIVTNHGSTPDAQMRVRCPVARASEPSATDSDEGGLSSRAAKSIAIPPNTTVTQGPGGFYVALLS